jgi:flagellar capping protein FliD
MSTTSTSSTSSYFTGTSAYSTDFSNVISRAVAIADLPIQQLTNKKTTLTSQGTELATLDTKFTALQTAVKNVASALGGSSFQASVSSPNVLDVSVADGAQEGYYAIQVNSIGAYESSMSSANWSVAESPSGTPTTFQLVVGNQNYSVTGTDNSAQSIADAINSNYGNLVQATTVIVAPGDTRISLKNVALGQTTLDLIQVPSSTATSLQSQSASGYSVSQSTATWDASGSPATFQLSIGSMGYSITPASNSAADVAAAINSTHGDQVRATVVDLGTSTTHDYRINLQAVTAGAINGSTTLDLRKGGGASLQTQQIHALSRSTASWDASADAAGTRSTYTLVIGSSKYSFTPADNSAASVASAINSLYGSKVHASVVDLETGGNPDYRISLQASSGTTVDIQKTSATSYQKEQTAGSLASYEVNSSGVTNTSTTRNITVSTGVTATLVGTTTSPVGITVARSTAALNTAMSGLADAYNAAVDAVAAQRGQSGGALGGQSIVNQLSSLLSSIGTYSSSGQIGSLAALGLDLGTDGHLTFSQFTLMAADIGSSASVTAFLGSATGGGFLKQATDVLASIENTTTGLLKAAQTDNKSAITKLTTEITTKQAVVDQMQINMQNQMAKADALIATMEQQYSYLSNMFSAQQTADQSYK